MDLCISNFQKQENESFDVRSIRHRNHGIIQFNNQYLAQFFFVIFNRCRFFSQKFGTCNPSTTITLNSPDKLRQAVRALADLGGTLAMDALGIKSTLLNELHRNGAAAAAAVAGQLQILSAGLASGTAPQKRQKRRPRKGGY